MLIVVVCNAVENRSEHERRAINGRNGGHAYLSSAVVAEQGEDLVFVHVEGEVVDHGGVAVGLLEVVHGHRGRAEQGLVHALGGDAAHLGGAVLHLPLDDADLDVLREACLVVAALVGQPVAAQEQEVPGARHPDLAGPHLGEVPAQRRVDEDVRELFVGHCNEQGG
jgi:hypothetical protein